MNESDPIYQAAYLAAQTIRDKTLDEKEREKRINQSVCMVEQAHGSFLEYHQLLSQALRMLSEKGI